MGARPLEIRSDRSAQRCRGFPVGLDAKDLTVATDINVTYLGNLFRQGEDKLDLRAGLIFSIGGKNRPRKLTSRVSPCFSIVPSGPFERTVTGSAIVKRREARRSVSLSIGPPGKCHRFPRKLASKLANRNGKGMRLWLSMNRVLRPGWPRNPAGNHIGTAVCLTLALGLTRKNARTGAQDRR